MLAVANAFDAEVGQRVKQARERVRLSVEELASEVGVAASTLYAWEKGSRGVSVEALLKISSIVGASMEELATGSMQEQNDVERLAQLFVRATEEAMAGASMPEAFDRTAPEPDELSRRERQFLERRTGEFRRFIEARARRPWSVLTETERLDLARSLIAELLD